MNIDSHHIGIVKPREFSFGSTPEDCLELECGKKLGPVTIRYETYGQLNQDKTNAVLILHALTGDAHLAGYHSATDRKPGWWDDMVGPDRPFDTNKYFIVCSNVIGGCGGSTGPRSINPETGERYNMTFPVITIADMVKAQKRLMDHLEIKKWLAVAGGSMGGMQALEWLVNYPDAMECALCVATTAKLSAQGIAFDWVGREAIQSDPNWQNGEYEETVPEKGLSIARMLAHITYLSDESMINKFDRSLQDINQYAYDFTKNFSVESYLDYQGRRFVERFDANSYLYITRAMDYYDVTSALNKVKCPVLLVSFSSDWLFPTYQTKEIVKAFQKNHIDVTYCDIDSSYGHDAFLLEGETLGTLMKDYLRNRYDEVHNHSSQS